MIYINVCSTWGKNNFERDLEKKIRLNFDSVIADDDFMKTVISNVRNLMDGIRKEYPRTGKYILSTYEHSQLCITDSQISNYENKCCSIKRDNSQSSFIDIYSMKVMRNYLKTDDDRDRNLKR